MFGRAYLPQVHTIEVHANLVSLDLRTGPSDRTALHPPVASFDDNRAIVCIMGRFGFVGFVSPGSKRHSGLVTNERAQGDLSHMVRYSIQRSFSGQRSVASLHA